MPNDQKPPSKTDMLNVLKDTNYKKPPEIIVLELKAESENDKLSDFENNNARYQKLFTAATNANDECRAKSRQAREDYNRELKRCRTAIRLYGATPKVVKMVETFTNKYL